MIADGGEGQRDRLDRAGESAARHGIAAPRGQSVPPGSRGGRFARMFPFLPAGGLDVDAVEVLVERMHAAAHDEVIPNDEVLAGYTYLGQFVDHDITFDPTSKLQRDNDPHALVNFRTPRFDLDSLYGSGPADQPFLYDWTGSWHPGVKLLVGTNPPGKRYARRDLPRNSQGRALIGDARNDENLIISQLHLLFIKFHNKVVDYVRNRNRRLTCTDLFEEAQRIVRWHYQWIVTHDFLERIVGKEMARTVLPAFALAPGVTAQCSEHRVYHWHREPVIPIEFSAAAYRFGHSMVRRFYTLKAGGERAAILPAPGHEGELHLGGFRRLPAALQIDWTRFFGPRVVVTSLPINHIIALPLFTLPPDGAALARLNLLRGRALGLPSGSDVARAMGHPLLTEDELLPEDFWPANHKPDERAAVLRAPPLWFYVLREAATGKGEGKHLGPVGGGIVAGVLVGLAQGDPNSYLRCWPAWTPELTAGGDFTMADLLEFTLGDDVHATPPT